MSKTNSINNQNETTMNENVKAADLIGKVIVVGDNIATITIKGVNEHGNLEGEFVKGDQPAIMMPVTMANLKAMMERGVWKFQESEKGTVNSEKSATAQTTDDDVQEVEDVQPEKHEPKAKEEGRGKKEDVKPTEKKAAPKGEKSNDKPKKEEPKAKAEPKPKQQKTKPEVKATGKLTYETYTSSKGKQCARILGFGENDPAYVNAAEIHGSHSWITTKDGRVLYIAFGPRYAEAAKQVCDALNAGKTLADCKAIVDKATEERAAKREEWKQKREEKKAANTEGKTYTEAEVLDLLKRVADGDKDALAMVDAMAKKAA